MSSQRQQKCLQLDPDWNLGEAAHILRFIVLSISPPGDCATTIQSSSLISRFEPFDSFRSSVRQVDPSSATSGFRLILFLQVNSLFRNAFRSQSFNTTNPIKFIILNYIVCIEYILACKLIARQRLWDKKIYNSRYCVTASQTNMFPRQKIELQQRGTVFSVRSVPRYKLEKLAAAVSQLSWLVREWVSQITAGA
jgi:hypothetical protein